jgi:hypothetical protein
MLTTRRAFELIYVHLVMAYDVSGLVQDHQKIYDDLETTSGSTNNAFTTIKRMVPETVGEEPVDLAATSQIQPSDQIHQSSHGGVYAGCRWWSGCEGGERVW